MSKFLPALLICGVLWALPETGLLQSPPSPCFLSGLPCNGGGSAALSGIIRGMVFSSTAKNIFGAFLALYLFVYGMRLILLGERSDVIQDTKMAYAYAITGCVMYIFANNFLDAFGSQNGESINVLPISSALMEIIKFINVVIWAVLTGMITYQAIRIIIKRGDDGEMEAARKRFVSIVFGVVVLSLANMIVIWAMPGNGASKLISEIVGVIRFILEIIGVLAVISFIYAGFLYIISANEGTTDTAKKTMKNTAIALIVVLFSYMIVTFAANGLHLQ